MKRMLLCFAVFAVMAGGLVGCHVSGSVDPHGSTQIVPAN